MADIDRRVMLLSAAGAILAATGPGVAIAGVIPTAAGHRLYDKAIVINGNLIAPLDPEGPLDRETAAQVRASGLTAFKMTLGGSGGETKVQVVETIAAFDKAIAASSDLYVKITSAADIPAAKRAGRIGVIYSFEAAEMLEGRLDNIDVFRALGVRVMGLSYNVATPFASGVLSPSSTGLTPLGRQAVERMNALGVAVDVSHSDEASSLAAVAVSRRPVLITHAGCDAVHAHPRNKSDRLLRALAERGGVVGIYELSFLTAPPAQPSMANYLDHLTHALKVCGEDHVGIGSDALLTPFDTSPASLDEWNQDIARRKAAGVGAPGEGPPPFVTGLNRPDRCEIIADALLRRGYGRRAVDKVLGANFQRVLTEAWSA